MTYYLCSKVRLAKIAAASAAVGACVAAAVSTFAFASAFASVEAADQGNASLQTACKPPATEGAMTVWIYEEGKRKCWRWK